jgi:NADPH2:quinone reductase
MGAYAEVRVLPEARLVKLPEAITERVAGSTMPRGLTAYILRYKVHAELEAGQTTGSVILTV